MFPEFLVSIGIMFQILGPRYLKLFRPLLAVLTGPVVKSVCDKRILFCCSNNSIHNVIRNIVSGIVQFHP